MTDEFKWPLLIGMIAGLAVCSLIDAVQISRLQAEVAFLRDVARETDLLRSNNE
jgi:hypothetical protein